MPRLVPAFEQFFDGSGDPLVNGLLDFFESGSSSVRKTTYADQGETIPNANPVVLGADGRAPDIFGTGNFRGILRTSSGVQVLQRDPVGGDQVSQFGADWGSTQTYSESEVVRDAGRYWESQANNNLGNRPSTDDGTNWSLAVLSKSDNIELSGVVFDLISDLRINFLAPNTLATIKGHTTINDGGGGEFVYTTGAAPGTYVDNNGTIIVPTGGDGSAAWLRTYTGLVNVHWFGVTGDGVTDDTAAINLAFNYIRSINTASGNERPVGIEFTQGKVYKVTSVNATQIRGSGWIIEGNGCEILATGAGNVGFDLLHSRMCTLNNILLRSDSVSPAKIGYQIGYMAAGISASHISFHNCHTAGEWTVTSYINFGAEESDTYSCQFRNELNSSSSYCVIHDGCNYWHQTSDYAITGDLLAVDVTAVTKANPAVVTAAGHGKSNGDKVSFRDIGGMTEIIGTQYTVANVSGDNFELSGIDSSAYTTYTTGGTVALNETYSFVNVGHHNSSAFKENGGPAVWTGWHSKRHRFENFYAYSNQNAVVIYFDPVASAGVNHEALYLDILIEGPATTGYRIQRNTGGDINVGDWTIRAAGSNVSDQLFVSDSVSGHITIVGFDLDIPQFQGYPSNGLFNPTGVFNIIGRLATRRAGGFTGMPRKFKGEVQVYDADDSTWGVGSYDINSLEMNGADINYTVCKGAKRFMGAEASTIANGALNTEDYIEVSGDEIVNSDADRVTWSTATTGGASSAGPGNQYIEIRIGGATYKVLHDGVVV